jgi:hypothetical protein
MGQLGICLEFQLVPGRAAMVLLFPFQMQQCIAGTDGILMIDALQLGHAR